MQIRLVSFLHQLLKTAQRLSLKNLVPNITALGSDYTLSPRYSAQNKLSGDSSSTWPLVVWCSVLFYVSTEKEMIFELRKRTRHKSIIGFLTRLPLLVLHLERISSGPFNLFDVLPRKVWVLIGHAPSVVGARRSHAYFIGDTDFWHGARCPFEPR